MSVKVGINGFGRIGRHTLRALQDRREVEIAAINDLTDSATLAHLLQYDSLYGKFPGTVEVQGDKLLINGRPVKILAEAEPEKLPWRELGVEIVIDATGKFRTHATASRHLQAGAKVIVTTC